jgi:phospholipid/cholesterol/gamma-HCH transport system permease protein
LPTAPTPPASLQPAEAGRWVLAGAWTRQGLGPLAQAGAWPARTDVGAGSAGSAAPVVLDGQALTALDSVGAWVLQRGLAARGGPPELRGWPPQALGLMNEVLQLAPPPPAAAPLDAGWLPGLGRWAVGVAQQSSAFLAFIGQVALAALQGLRQPGQWRAAAVSRAVGELRLGGFDALPIIGLMAFLLGVVVAFQGADQLRHYGANVFVVELVGYAMLREFAPLIVAIIIAGRSGSAYAALIGSMVVQQEIDALRTLGIDPLQRLVLPRVVAMVIALPLLTVFADVAGVFGGMVMASVQLDIGFAEFLARFGRVMQGTALLVGVGKSLVFALIIVAVGCFQGLRTAGNAESVGRQTTLSVVQAIFLVIVVDALFSVLFNALDI